MPVTLTRTIDQKRCAPGTPVQARLVQRVPLPGGAYFSQDATIEGKVLSCDRQRLSLAFTTLSVGGKSEPFYAKLLAGAYWLAVAHTRDPLSATTRGTGDPGSWTTRQIGGDELYLQNGMGRAYNRFSEPVGHADRTGVYADAAKPGGLERALGPFSADSSGLTDMPGLALDAGGDPISFRLLSPDWKLHKDDALLLEVTRP